MGLTFSVVMEGSLNMKLLLLYCGGFFDVVEMIFYAFSSRSALNSLAQLFALLTLLFCFRSGEVIVPVGVSFGLNS